MNAADQEIRNSPLWGRLVDTHAKLAAAQLVKDGAALAKAWRELGDLIEANPPLEDPSSLSVNSIMAEQLESAFLPLANKS
jgi:hypothetical protein